MDISSISSLSSVSSADAAEELVTTDEFLQLFVVQLQNQNPLEPMEGSEFMAQLAQFSSLEQLIQLNQLGSDQFEFDQLVEGANLIGKEAAYYDSDTGELTTGTIDGIEVDGDSISLIIKSILVPLSSITEIYAGEIA